MHTVATYPLFVSVVGSHMWGMQTEQSDKDLALIYAVDPHDLLAGYSIPTKKNNIFRYQNCEYDIQYYEIGHIVNLLIKGNVNAIWAVCSPVSHQLIEINPLAIIPTGDPAHIVGQGVQHRLKSIVLSNLSKQSYYSIYGMATSQYNDHEKRADVMPRGKALLTCIRTCIFGIELLTNNRLAFAQPPIINLDSLKIEAEWYLTQLSKAYERSTLPEKPDESQFRDFLFKFRHLILSIDEKP